MFMTRHFHRNHHECDVTADSWDIQPRVFTNQLNVDYIKLYITLYIKCHITAKMIRLKNVEKCDVTADS